MATPLPALLIEPFPNPCLSDFGPNMSVAGVDGDRHPRHPALASTGRVTCFNCDRIVSAATLIYPQILAKRESVLLNARFARRARMAYSAGFVLTAVVSWSGARSARLKS
jgi:hypothetical protein